MFGLGIGVWASDMRSQSAYRVCADTTNRSRRDEKYLTGLTPDVPEVTARQGVKR